MGGQRTPTYGGRYDILSLWGLDYTLYIGGGMFHRGPPIEFPIEAYRGPIGKYGVYAGVPTYTPRRGLASVWLGRPPPTIGVVPPYPAFGGLTYPLWGVYYSLLKKRL